MAAAKWIAMDPLAALSDDDDDDEEQQQQQESLSSDDAAPRLRAPASPCRPFQSAPAAASPPIPTNAVRLDFETLSRHGYTGGLSILNVPAPVQDAGPTDWSWSSGKRKSSSDAAEPESIDQRERTRAALSDEAELAAAQAVAAYNFTKKQKRDIIAEQKAVSFAQKEKRKREMGQASRGKNYVEEEKRLLRDSGVYSGFDT